MDQSKNTEQWYSKLFRVFNSAVCFSLAYLLLTYAFWFATGFASRIYKFDAKVYYYGIKFILNNHSWTATKVTLIYLAGPVFCLIAGLIARVAFRESKKEKTMISVFLLWLSIIGSCIFVAQGIVAILGAYQYQSSYYHGLAVVLSWWRVPMFVIYLIGAGCIALLIYFAINYARPFLLFSYSYSKVNKLSRRRKYFFETAMAPFVLGAFITSLVTMTMSLPYNVNMPVHVIYLSVIAFALIVAWYALSYIEVLKGDISRFKSLQQPNLVFVIFLGAVWVFIYFSFRGMWVS